LILSTLFQSEDVSVIHSTSAAATEEINDSDDMVKLIIIPARNKNCSDRI